MSASTKSTSSSPKKTGILIVGLGGNNGVTLLAGHYANANRLSWETGGCPGKGRVSAPNWGGCITQLEPKGAHGGVGYKGLYELADAQQAAVGGWDIRPTPLGEALYESRVIDYDLVRQVRDSLNQVPILRGVYKPSFLGETQHATATHIVDISQMKTVWEVVEHLRKDIRNFITENGVDGHTTVIWSASVERPADVGHLITPQELIDEMHSTTETDISPSMMYATAAALEGCSFVNGGSQNTLCPALSQLFEADYRNILKHDMNMSDISTECAYLLGTDFKAGQTKFKTAAVEYLRALGLTPRVIASSNHLGNNDMLNLTSQTTLNAKLRVKHSIFEPWQEDQLDHQVKVMYVPFMGDEKRDMVEYTSTAFLHQEHCMLTYTRCMDSILCVPLMIDAAIWCDYFARFQTPASMVAKATAYLFKVPEGAALGVDPGFHHQMQTLQTVLQQVDSSQSSKTVPTSEEVVQVLPPSTAPSEKKMGVQELLHKGLASGILNEEQVAKLRSLM